MGNKPSLSVCDIGFVVDGRKFRIGFINNFFPAVCDINMMMERKHLCCGKQGHCRFTKPLHIVDIRFFSCLTETMVFGKYAHSILPPAV